MTEAGIVAIVVALIGAVGAAAKTILDSVLSRSRAEPIRQDDVVTAAAHESSRLALALAKSLETELERNRKDLQAERAAREQDNARHRAELATERAARESTDEKVQRLQEQRAQDTQRIASLRRALDALVAAWRDLHERWDELRALPTPPPMPTFDSD